MVYLLRSLNFPINVQRSFPQVRKLVFQHGMHRESAAEVIRKSPRIRGLILIIFISKRHNYLFFYFQLLLLLISSTSSRNSEVRCSCPFIGATSSMLPTGWFCIL